jgi:hypothetical protein
MNTKIIEIVVTILLTGKFAKLCCTELVHAKYKNRQ